MRHKSQHSINFRLSSVTYVFIPVRIPIGLARLFADSRDVMSVTVSAIILWTKIKNFTTGLNLPYPTHPKP